MLTPVTTEHYCPDTCSIKLIPLSLNGCQSSFNFIALFTEVGFIVAEIIVSAANICQRLFGAFPLLRTLWTVSPGQQQALCSAFDADFLSVTNSS